jgi:hypothetical protein
MQNTDNSTYVYMNNDTQTDEIPPWKHVENALNAMARLSMHEKDLENYSEAQKSH